MHLLVTTLTSAMRATSRVRLSALMYTDTKPAGVCPSQMAEPSWHSSSQYY
jgi:hypothetical protein